MYCQVIVDIVHENVAHTFTYAVPEGMKLQPGQRVAVPFGAREKEGCVISLSDRLTDWSVIENRLRMAARGDFAICLYNPASRHRGDYLRRACAILREEKDGGTVCGLVRNVGREGESWRILTLDGLSEAEADMFTTVFIGSSTTLNIGGRMVTPRGYRR